MTKAQNKDQTSKKKSSRTSTTKVTKMVKAYPNDRLKIAYMIDE
jgi:hypothetical protein